MEIGSSFGTIGRLLGGALSVRDRLDLLVRQASDGRRAESYAGLGVDARRSIDLRAEVARRESYTRAIDVAQARIAVMQPALGRIGEIASDMAAKALSLITLDTPAVTATAVAAREALREVASLLNAQAGEVFVFGGADTTRPPVPNADAILSSPFFLAIEAATRELGEPWDHDSNSLTPDVPRSAAQVLLDTRDIAASDDPAVTPFSPFLSELSPDGAVNAPRASLLAEDGARVTYGIVANANAVSTVVSSEPTTGSYMRDILRGIAMLASLTEDEAASEEFAPLLQGIAASLRAAHQALEDDRAALGVAEQRLSRAKEAHADVKVVLAAQIASVEDVDIAEVTARLQLLQVQLEMSYRLIGALRDLNLARYL